MMVRFGGVADARPVRRALDDQLREGPVSLRLMQTTAKNEWEASSQASPKKE